jgi:Protein of unknown function (DUF3306)
MSESENFLSRWSRLKRESGSEESGIDEKRTADALPNADIPSSAAFDPACLPPIESIVADSDIRLFLQACVPAELTRAALRSAWTADPAIRDFIGIAESQWDFNDPATIPGFGSLGATDYARNLAARAVGSLNNAAEGVPESSRVAEQPASTNTDPKYCEPVDDGGQVLPLPADSSRDAALEITGVDSVAQRDTSEATLGPRARRSHGGALPK